MSPKSRSFRRFLIGSATWVGIIVLVLAIVAVWFLDNKVRERAERALAKQRQEVTDNVDFFCEQQEKLAADPWFHEPRTAGGDAAPVLNTWVVWEPQTETPKDSPLVLPKQLSMPDKDWVSASVDISSLDFGWMQRLHAYDRWDYLKSRPLAPPKPSDWPLGGPTPRLEVLRDWSKLRLLQGLRSGQPMEAAKDVRHLAWILHRSESLLHSVYATVLLDLEREAHDSMREPPPEWQPMSGEQIARMKALLFSSVTLTTMAAPLEVAKKARHCGPPAVTFCSGLGTVAAEAKLAKPVAEDDEEFREAYAAFKAELAASPCVTSTAQSVWEHGLTMDEPWAQGDKLSTRVYMRALRDSTLARQVLIRSFLEAGGLKPLHSFRKTLEEGR